MNISVIGTGYVGLTTGVALAHLGHKVVCADIDEAKVELLNKGIPPIYEPDLEELMAKARSRLTFTTSYREAILESDVVFIAVGTPANADGSPNLTYLHESFDHVLKTLAHKATPTLLVNKSTVPVGTADRFMDEIHRRGMGKVVDIASNPEFLRQGRAVYDTLHPERIVAGGSERAARILQSVYKPLLDKEKIPFLHVDLRSAELAKYAANAFLAMKISFINEMANVCDCVGADVLKIAEVIGSDHRIGPAFLNAGIGYGGSCFPKDTRALRYIADTNGYNFKLLSAVIEVNNDQRNMMVQKLRRELGELAGRKVAVLGLTFKPATDDLREAPSIPVIQELLALGAQVWAHDPVAMEKAKELLPAGVHFAKDCEECLQDAEAALLVTEWPEYLRTAPAAAPGLMKRPLFIDGRNAIPENARTGLEYHGIGIPGTPRKEEGPVMLQF